MPDSEISREKLEQRTRNILLHQLSRSAKTKQQLRELLLKREIDPAIFEPILDRFEQSQLIDDLAFAKGFVASRLRTGKSRSQLSRELAKRGVSRDFIEVALADVDRESELATASELAAKRLGRLANLDPEIAHRRIVGFLMRRGYSSEVVSQALRNAKASR